MFFPERFLVALCIRLHSTTTKCTCHTGTSTAEPLARFGMTWPLGKLEGVVHVKSPSRVSSFQHDQSRSPSFPWLAVRKERLKKFCWFLTTSLQAGAVNWEPPAPVPLIKGNGGSGNEIVDLWGMGNSHMKAEPPGILVVSLRGVHFGLWSQIVPAFWTKRRHMS